MWIVAGAPGAGKSTVAGALLRLLSPVPALLDKDLLFGGLVGEVLSAHGRPPGEREGAWYDQHVKVHEYHAMTTTARSIRMPGCPVLLEAPFTRQIRDPELWREWVEELGGARVQLVWVRADPGQLRERLELRGLARDSGKLSNFEAFITRMRPNDPPPVPHLEVDNRSGAPPINLQVRSLLQPE